MLYLYLLVGLASVNAENQDVYIQESWHNGFHGYIRLAPEEDLHGWKIRVNFNAAVGTLQVWNAKIIHESSDRKEFVLTNVDVSEHVMAGSTLKLDFIVRGTVSPIHTATVTLETGYAATTTHAATTPTTVATTTTPKTIATTTPTTIVTTTTPQVVQSCVDDSRINCDQSVCNTDLRMFCPSTCRDCSPATTSTPCNDDPFVSCSPSICSHQVLKDFCRTTCGQCPGFDSFLLTGNISTTQNQQPAITNMPLVVGK
ncbi:mucin-2-like isoform X2 [Mytilus edulis]|uniref:mucin-2-like isoform X2 n=1 Tax=Mytilus edulis TaxID=6550 RepID=UPI0039EDFDA7